MGGGVFALYLAARGMFFVPVVIIAAFTAPSGRRRKKIMA
jgi:hypothetical protein